MPPYSGSIPANDKRDCARLGDFAGHRLSTDVAFIMRPNGFLVSGYQERIVWHDSGYGGYGGYYDGGPRLGTSISVGGRNY